MNTCRPLLVVFALGLAFPVFADSAAARDILVDYSLSVRGFPVGKAELKADVVDRSYEAAFNAGISGIARLFAKIDSNVHVNGELGEDRPHAIDYAHTWRENDETQAVTMHFSGDGVTKIDIQPPIKRPERYVPLTADLKAHALDLVSAFLWVAPAGVAPETCNRTLPLIDGRRRFNLIFAYRRMDSLAMRHSFLHTRTVVCSLRYKPLAGQRKDKEDSFLSSGDAEIWLASAGGGLLVPVKVKLPTRIGGIVMQVTKLQAK